MLWDDRSRPPTLPLLDGRFPLPLDRPFTLLRPWRRHLTSPAPDAGAGGAGAPDPQGCVRRRAGADSITAAEPRVAAVRTPPTSVVTDWTACWFYSGVLPAGSARRLSALLTVFRPAGHDRLRNTSVREWRTRHSLADDLIHVGRLCGSRRRFARPGTWAGLPTVTGPSARWTHCCGSVRSPAASWSPGSSGSRACAAWYSSGNWRRLPMRARSPLASRRCGCAGSTSRAFLPRRRRSRSWSVALRCTGRPRCARAALRL